MFHFSSIIIHEYLNIVCTFLHVMCRFFYHSNKYPRSTRRKPNIRNVRTSSSQEFQRSRDTSRARIEITDLYVHTTYIYIYIYRSLRVTTNIDIETLFSHYTGRRTKHYRGISCYFFADNRSILVANMAKKSEQIATQTVRHEPARLSNREGTNEDGTKKGEE